MDPSDFVEFGAGLGMGAIMTRSINGSFYDALEERSSMGVLTVPQTRAEIQALLDKLDVRLANGDLSEDTYTALTGKWEKRMSELGK